MMDATTDARMLGLGLNRLHSPVSEDAPNPMRCRLCSFAMYDQGDAGLTHWPLPSEFGTVRDLLLQMDGNFIQCADASCPEFVIVDPALLHDGFVAERGQEVKGAAIAQGWSRNGDEFLCPRHS